MFVIISPSGGCGRKPHICALCGWETNFNPSLCRNPGWYKFWLAFIKNNISAHKTTLFVIKRFGYRLSFFVISPCWDCSLWTRNQNYRVKISPRWAVVRPWKARAYHNNAALPQTLRRFGLCNRSPAAAQSRELRLCIASISVGVWGSTLVAVFFNRHPSPS